MRLRLGSLGAFPPSGRPRILWLGVEEIPEAGRLAALASALESAVRRFGLPPEERPFRSHLTLARADRRTRAESPSSGALGGIGELDALEVVLFRSELGPGGARYTALERFPLGPSAIVPPQ
jgi:2'-5' RNA ligase